MQIVNSNDVTEIAWRSPNGTFAGTGKQISEALGRKPASTDLLDRHPFDVEIARIALGQTPYPYHSHSAQWEFYHVISGRGHVRHAARSAEIAAGDAFLFKPGEAHQLINTGSEDLILYIVADNAGSLRLATPGPLADRRQVFPGKSASGVRSDGNELLGNTVLYAAPKARLCGRNSFAFAPDVLGSNLRLSLGRSSLLQGSPQARIARAARFNTRPGGRRAVAGRCSVDDAENRHR